MFVPMDPEAGKPKVKVQADLLVRTSWFRDSASCNVARQRGRVNSLRPHL